MFGLNDALSAFEAAAEIGAHWKREYELPPLLSPQVSVGEISTLTEAEAKALLMGRGLVVPVGEECTISAAPQVAARIGFPVTLKVSSAKVAHKTELAGVRLNLQSETEVAAAAAAMRHLSGFVLVEKMVTGVIAEMIVGIKRDPQFGLALVIGAGGTLAELLKDTVALLLPTSRMEILHAVKQLRVWTLVEGFRGTSGDQEAVLRAIEAIAAFAQDHATALEELDVNPLLVLSDGAVAVDAYIRMRPPA